MCSGVTAGPVTLNFSCRMPTNCILNKIKIQDAVLDSSLSLLVTSRSINTTSSDQVAFPLSAPTQSGEGTSLLDESDFVSIYFEFVPCEGPEPSLKLSSDAIAEN